MTQAHPTLFVLGDTALMQRWSEWLRSAGYVVSPGPSTPHLLAEQTYDARGAVVVDLEWPGAPALLEGPQTVLLPLLVGAEATRPLPAGAFRLRPDFERAELLHHVAEVLRTRRNLRRHPRVPVELPVSAGGVNAKTRNVSLYGLRLAGQALSAGWTGALEVGLADGAVIRLRARVVARPDEDTALAVRPLEDTDLVVWLHLLLERLARSPLHEDVDPFGPLFSED
jgi:hypothetical protein